MYVPYNGRVLEARVTVWQSSFNNEDETGPFRLPSNSR